jgi:hypothetical protein
LRILKGLGLAFLVVAVGGVGVLFEILEPGRDESFVLFKDRSDLESLPTGLRAVALSALGSGQRILLALPLKNACKPTVPHHVFLFPKWQLLLALQDDLHLETLDLLSLVEWCLQAVSG